MPAPSEQHKDRKELRDRVIGLGERSFHKSYYPQLRLRLDELERFRALVDHSAYALLLLRLPDGELTYLNPAACNLLGLSPSQIGSRMGALLGTEFWHRLQDIPIAIDGENRAVEPVRIDVTRKTDRPLPIEWSVGRHSVTDNDYLVVNALDLTRRLKIEEQLRQKQRMESIGRLAGGVAHDLNNLLSPVLGYGEMLLDALDLEKEYAEYVEEIILAGFRARALINQLLAFSRKQTLEYKPVDMNEVVKGFKNLLRRTIREDVKIEIVLSPGIRNVMADIGQIEQVLMNLAINAADAMTEGGYLTIETANIDLDRHYVDAHQGANAGPHVMLAVSDTGCGMNSETCEHLFDPFYSTKGERGTGLGLATVYGIIKQHGGNIWVYSEPGNGTTFKVYLPVRESAVSVDRHERTAIENLEGTETVLLVEDNDQVRRLAHTILMLRRYKVLTAKNGIEALAMMESHAGPVHLLLTDVVMPEMNGKELFHRASEKQTALKVLYMSGYTDNVVAHRGVLEDGINFLQKPFTAQSLAAKVREALEG